MIFGVDRSKHLAQSLVVIREQPLLGVFRRAHPNLHGLLVASGLVDLRRPLHVVHVVQVVRRVVRRVRLLNARKRRRRVVCHFGARRRRGAVRVVAAC